MAKHSACPVYSLVHIYQTVVLIQITLKVAGMHSSVLCPDLEPQKSCIIRILLNIVFTEKLFTQHPNGCCLGCCVNNFWRHCTLSDPCISHLTNYFQSLLWQLPSLLLMTQLELLLLHQNLVVINHQRHLSMLRTSQTLTSVFILMTTS